ncbi:uncharacterized protein LOC141923137 [Strix aluco]|uniref:uncharacterized protein LOC141923137 n=1 Tax=Strix aluco TaxID=111821 RepID=UPI003DA4EE68
MASVFGGERAGPPRGRGPPVWGNAGGSPVGTPGSPRPPPGAGPVPPGCSCRLPAARDAGGATGEGGGATTGGVAVGDGAPPLAAGSRGAAPTPVATPPPPLSRRRRGRPRPRPVSPVRGQGPGGCSSVPGLTCRRGSPPRRSGPPSSALGHPRGRREEAGSGRARVNPEERAGLTRRGGQRRGARWRAGCGGVEHGEAAGPAASGQAGGARGAPVLLGAGLTGRRPARTQHGGRAASAGAVPHFRSWPCPTSGLAVPRFRHVQRRRPGAMRGAGGTREPPGRAWAPPASGLPPPPALGLRARPGGWSGGTGRGAGERGWGGPGTGPGRVPGRRVPRLEPARRVWGCLRGRGSGRGAVAAGRRRRRRRRRRSPSPVPPRRCVSVSFPRAQGWLRSPQRPSAPGTACPAPPRPSAAGGRYVGTEGAGAGRSPGGSPREAPPPPPARSCRRSSCRCPPQDDSCPVNPSAMWEVSGARDAFSLGPGVWYCPGQLEESSEEEEEEEDEAWLRFSQPWDVSSEDSDPPYNFCGFKKSFLCEEPPRAPPQRSRGEAAAAAHALGAPAHGRGSGEERAGAGGRGGADEEEGGEEEAEEEGGRKTEKTGETGPRAAKPTGGRGELLGPAQRWGRRAPPTASVEEGAGQAGPSPSPCLGGSVAASGEEEMEEELDLSCTFVFKAGRKRACGCRRPARRSQPGQRVRSQAGGRRGRCPHPSPSPSRTRAWCSRA